MPVRVSTVNQKGVLAECVAYTLSLSLHGAQLAGVTVPVKVGNVVRLQRGRATANFRVVWIGSEADDRPGQIGVASTLSVSNFWGLEESKPLPDIDLRAMSRRRDSAPPA